MSSYEISTLAGLAAAAVALTRNGTVVVPVNGRPVTVRFQADTVPDAQAAHNVLVTVRNLNSSADFNKYLSESGPDSFIVNVTTSKIGLPSSGRTFFGSGVININTTETEREYRTSDGQWEKFTLQHILNHEFMHAVTGLDDTPDFIRIVNGVNSQTQAGPNRLSYEAVRCFLAGTPILMADGSEKNIENIKPGDFVSAFDCKDGVFGGKLEGRRVSRIFRNTAHQIINLRGVKCTPGHVFLTRDDKGNYFFETIARILRNDGVIVSASGSIIRARTGAETHSLSDVLIRVEYVDILEPGNPHKKHQIMVRAGIPMPAFQVSNKSDIIAEDTLLYNLAQQEISIKPDGSLITATGKKYIACNWPNGSTPFDTPHRRNWIVEVETKKYTPPWIVGLHDYEDRAPLQLLE